MITGTVSSWRKAIVPATLALFALCVFGTKPPSTSEGCLIYGIVLALSFTLPAFFCWKYSAESPFGGDLPAEYAPLLIPSTAFLLAASILKLGMIQFGGFDHSALIDMGWRIHLGQKPFRDFPCTMPPLFYLGAGSSFDLFGVRWWSLIALAAAYSFATFLWSYGLLLRVFGDRFGAWLYAFMIQICTSVLVSYWWYNPVTTIAAVLVFLSFWLLFGTSDSWRVRASCVASLSLLSLAKPNIAGVMIVGMLVIGLFSGKRLLVISMMTASAVIALTVLAIAGIRPRDVVEGYLGIASRGASFNQLFQDLGAVEKILFTSLLLLLLIPCLMNARQIFRHRRNPLLWFSAVGMVAGLYGFVTNGEAKPVDLPMVFLSALSAVCLLGSDQKNHSENGIFPAFSWRRYYLIQGFLIMGISCAQAVTRHRVEAIGPGIFFEYRLSVRRPSPEFFKGMHTGDTFPEVCSEVASVLAGADRYSVYFGPRMQWAYAAFGLNPPTNQPPWWDPGVAFPKSMENKYISAWASQKFDTLIFFKNDLTYMPQEFIELLVAEYSVDQSYPLLTVLHRKPSL
jgi:hypothetical protein